MFLEYYYKKPKYSGYNFPSNHKFKHIIELDSYNKQDCSPECKNGGDCNLSCTTNFNFNNSVYRSFHVLSTILGYNPDRADPIIDYEANIIRIYFKHKIDATSFKLLWVVHV